jgi:hypothetical protein
METCCSGFDGVVLHSLLLQSPFVGWRLSACLFTASSRGDDRDATYRSLLDPSMQAPPRCFLQHGLEHPRDGGECSGVLDLRLPLIKIMLNARMQLAVTNWPQAQIVSIRNAPGSHDTYRHEPLGLLL